MRILLIHNYTRKTGGEGVAFDREYAFLRGAGHDVLALQKSTRDFESASGGRRLLLTLLSVFNLPAYLALRRTIRQFRPAVAIVHTAFPLWSVAAFVALLTEHVPIVHVVHNFRLRCLNGLYFRDGAPCTLCRDGSWWHGVRHRCVHGSWTRSLAYGVITQTVWPFGIVRRIAAFRALSAFSAERLVEMGVSRNRVHVIPNFAPRLELTRQPTVEPTWAFVGNLATEKGLHVALEALAAGAPGRLVIMGSGPAEGDLRRRVTEERLPVEFLGTRDGVDRFEVLRQAWALVFPSLCFENGPLAVLEAFSLGVPVVASRIGSIPDYVIDGVSGRLFAPGDAVELAEVLRALARDPAQRDRLSAGAAHAARHRFGGEAVGWQVDALLRSTVLHSPPGDAS